MHLSAHAALFAILGALFIGAMSPGPSFVFVVRTAVARSRADGFAAALGMGVGAMTFGALALVGLHTLMSEAGGLYWAGVAVATALLLYEHSLVRVNDLSRLDAAFFTMNGIISIAFFVFVLVERLARAGLRLGAR